MWGHPPFLSMHKLTDTDPIARTAVCSECGPTTIQSKGRDRWRCTHSRTRTKNYTTPEMRRASKLRANYGISVEEYERLFRAQDGVCAICKRPEIVEGRRLAVDHDHNTEQVRGLLCTACNRGIGCLRDDPEIVQAAVNYLRGQVPLFHSGGDT